MATTSDDRFYKRKLNEFEEELKRLQRELAKLKVLKREGGRARKQMLRSLYREMELQSVLEEQQMEHFRNIQVDETVEKPCCKNCASHKINSIHAGNRTIIICQACETRYTIHQSIAETA
jgi:hypothetical protein